MGQLHLPLHSAPILLFSELKMMRTQVAIVFFLAVAALAEESIISYDAEDHKHEQSGDAGNAVQGSYSHTDAEGNTYTVTYVADENGYRAEGDICPWRPKCRWWSKPKLPPLPRCLKRKLPLPPHHCQCLTLAELCQLLTTCRLPSATATAWLTRSTTATLTTTTDSHTSTKLLLLLILAHVLIGCLIAHLVLLTD